MLLLIPLVGCESEPDADEMASDSTPVAAAPAPLYERLGGQAAISSVVDTFVAHAAGDRELNFVRSGTANEWEATPENIATLKERLVQFVGSATGGPEQYGGQDMVTAHAGMEITNAEFDRLAGHLQMALDAHDVPADLQAELLAVVETTRAQIVTADSAR